MDNSFQTSFIPKKPIETSTSHIKEHGKSAKNPLMILALPLFIITVLICGGCYFYKSYLTKQKESLSSNIEQIKNGFDENTITSLSLFNKRIEASKQILADHTSVSPIFTLIGDATIPAVWFSNFLEEKTDGNTIVKLSGVSNDFRSVAIQADTFNNTKNSKYFKNVVFSDINRDLNNNKVTFDVEFKVDPSVLSYSDVSNNQ